MVRVRELEGVRDRLLPLSPPGEVADRLRVRDVRVCGEEMGVRGGCKAEAGEGEEEEEVEAAEDGLR